MSINELAQEASALPGASSHMVTSTLNEVQALIPVLLADPFSLQNILIILMLLSKVVPAVFNLLTFIYTSYLDIKSYLYRYRKRKHAAALWSKLFNPKNK